MMRGLLVAGVALAVMGWHSAGAQTNTYKWTDPADSSTGSFTLPSTWKFSGPVFTAAVTADGTISKAPSGAPLNTVAGTWTWGAAAAGRPGEYNVQLNGTNNGTGSSMEVAHGGQFYVDTASGQWWVWNGTAYAAVAAP